MRIVQRAVGVLVLLLVLAGAMLGSTQLAGKPERGSLSLVLVDSTDGVPHYGQHVTFEVATSVTEKPLVKVLCYQEGALVYWASAGFYPEYPWAWARNFTLSSAHWTGGPAECTADLYYSQDGRRFRTLATLPFSVYA
jgi:hypothetical protein